MSRVALPPIQLRCQMAAGGREGMVVFSDVDDTIIHGKSLVGFADYLARTLPSHERDQLQAVMVNLLARRRAGESRTELNRAYYAGVLRARVVEEVRTLARSWYLEARERGKLYNEPVCRFLSYARQAGAKIVMLSGSFGDLLEPIAAEIGAAAMIVAPLERRNGRYTGRLVGAPTVEDGKAVALCEYARSKGLELSKCCGAGDDLTDIPFLELLGWRFVPNNATEEMLQLALSREWRVLSGSPATDVAGYLPW